MNLSKVREILDKHRGLVLAGVVLAILSIWLLVPGQPDPEKLQGLLERGNYQAAREGAEQVLAREPESHSLREILVRACLGEGRYTEAMEHMLFLASSGWDTEPLERDFKETILPLAEDQEESSSLLVLLAAELAMHSNWDWLREYGLIVLSWGGGASKAPEYLAALEYTDIEKHAVHLTTIWSKVKEQQDWDLAWRTAAVMDPLVRAAIDEAWERDDHETVWEIEEITGHNRLHGFLQGFTCRLALIQDIFAQDAGKFAVLQKENPDNPLLAVGRANSSGQLDWLVQWEREHQVDEEHKNIYSTLKSQLITRAETVESSQLANILPFGLLGAALADVNNEEKLSLIINYLDKYFYMADELEIARTALDVPEPIFILEGYNYAQLTGDGKGLIIAEFSDYDTTHKYHDLETGEEFDLPSGNYFPSPDSSLLAIDTYSEDGEISIYDRGQLVAEYPKDNFIDRLGWRDSKTLWVVRKELEYKVGNVNHLYIMNIADGGMRKVEAVPWWKEDTWNSTWFGPQGRFAWKEGQVLRVYDGSKIYSVDLPADTFLYVQGWRPDGGALILDIQGYGSYYYTVGGRLEENTLDISVTSWLNNYEIATAYPLGTVQHMLGIYNIKTEEVIWTGIVSPISVAGDRVLAGGLDALYIYELEGILGGD